MVYQGEVSMEVRWLGTLGLCFRKQREVDASAQLPLPPLSISFSLVL